MALKGTLNDLNIIELVQYPHKGRKGGLMIIDDAGEQALLFYRDGNVIHAMIGQLSGFDAVVEILGLKCGDFEFIPDQISDVESIEQDLHQLLMKALKAKDERRFSKTGMQNQENPNKNTAASVDSQPLLSSGTAPSAAASPPLSKNAQKVQIYSQELQSIADQHQFITYICILAYRQESDKTDDVGEVVMEAAYNKTAEADETFAQMQASMSTLISAQVYSGGDLEKLMMQENRGIVTLSSLGDYRWLMVVSSNRASLGSVSLTVGKIASQLTR